jgi:hypothetical protein
MPRATNFFGLGGRRTQRLVHGSFHKAIKEPLGIRKSLIYWPYSILAEASSDIGPGKGHVFDTTGKRLEDPLTLKSFNQVLQFLKRQFGS